MMNEKGRGNHAIAIASLIVACISLAGTLVLAGFFLARSNTERVANAELPNYLTENQIAEIAIGVTEPFNSEDFATLYSRFDAIARSQFTMETLQKQLTPLRSAIGNIESAKYDGWQKIASAGTLPVYQLRYTLKLSGGQYSGGSMNLNVIDHGDQAGLVYFFVGGTTPQ